MTSDNDFHIEASSDVLFLKYDEQWAIDGYKDRFGEALVERAKNLRVPKWAVIDDISNWPVKIPEEMEMCSDMTENLVKIGFSHCAVFGHEYAISKWMMKRVLPEDIEVAFFATLTESQQWLQKLGYEANFTDKNPAPVR